MTQMAFVVASHIFLMYFILLNLVSHGWEFQRGDGWRYTCMYVHYSTNWVL